MDGQVVRCPQCGQANRVPPVGSGKTAVCGKCRAPLVGAQSGAAADNGHPVVLTDATFASSIRNGSYVVDFWAAWCGPCKMLEPVLEELAEEQAGKVTFARLNVDEQPLVTRRLDVMSMPTLIVFRDGRPVKQLVGARGKASLRHELEEFLA